MTEQDLIDLGFTKEVDPGVQCSDEEGNEWTEDEYHYYVYDLVIGLGLISCASDHVVDGEWFVDLFDTWPEIRFTDKEEVRSLINLLKSRMIEDEAFPAVFQRKEVNTQTDQQ